MTFSVDIFGDRPPVRMPLPEADDDLGPMRDDWKGEHLIRAPKKPLGPADLEEPRTLRERKQHARRVKVRECFERGMNETDTAVELKCGSNTVRNDLIFMGLKKGVRS